MTSAILPLPAEVIAQIKSSAAITSLNGVVLGLLGNSLDAGAVRVEIEVDFRRGGCTVEDDGVGIPPAEFQEDSGLGKMYYTSKFGAQTQVHGHNGTFLSSLAALSLVITRLTPSPAHQHLSFRHHGTRITIRDLFGNMPVRVKQRALASAEQGDGEVEWEEVKRGIVGLLLGEGRELSVVIRDVEKGRKFVIRPPGSSSRVVSLEPRNFHESRDIRPTFDLQLTRGILSQASYISRGSWDSWVPLSATTPYLSIHGAISLDPAPTKQVQFISLGVNPMGLESGNNLLSEEVNRLFAASDFGAAQDESDVDEGEKERRLRDRRYKSDGYTHKQLKGGRKGVDRWPMFFLRINLERQRGARLGFVEDELMRNDDDLRSVLELLGAATTEFLTANHFRPRARRTRAPTNDQSRDERLKSRVSDEDSSRSPSPTLYHAGNDASSKTRFILPRRPLGATRTESKGDSGSRESRSSASQPDMLGNNVRLPSFSGNTTKTTDSIINLWSRIKSGKIDFLEDGCSAVPVVSNRSTSSGTSEDPDPDPALKTIDTPPAIRGKLTFQEYDMPEPSGPPSGSGEVQNDVSIAEDPDPSEGSGGLTHMLAEDDTTDTLIPWTNPTTNGRFLINPRTGMASAAPKDSEGARQGVLLAQGTPDGVGPYKRTRLRSKADDKVVADPNNWIGKLLKDWNNPVFRQTEEQIQRVSLLEGTSAESSNILHGHHHYCSQAEIEKAFKESTSALPERLSKESLRVAEVIAQADKKFILVKVAASTEHQGLAEDAVGRDLLVVIDQHAADERCRIEGLLQDLCSPPPPEPAAFRSGLGFTSRIATTVLAEPLTFRVPAREHRLFEIHAKHLADWGILYDLPSPPPPPSGVGSGEPGCGVVVVRTLPGGIAERCRAQGGKLALELLRGEVWGREEEKVGAGGRRARGSGSGRGEAGWEAGWEEEDCWVRVPFLTAVMEVGAIMFNDELSREECEVLVRRLAGCRFPFQCAHGR
ncbi:hypothetical protein FGG08_007502 [Glutinoglossum americanum]|uniref:MutL C-terminal dimerisation domain-containing protein n=1 Tax=Glutinoglossum americanum TaxID=1670608 RepID=A0A9P8KTU8_9PEZI|nr:hypothetical protein FGG08_007502 [Glutinoglossum americanum]